MTHISIGNLIIIGLDNGLSPGRRQAIIWTNAGILLIGPSGTNFSEILIKILTFSFKKMHLKVSSAKWRPFCLCLNVLRLWAFDEWHTATDNFFCHRKPPCRHAVKKVRLTTMSIHVVLDYGGSKLAGIILITIYGMNLRQFQSNIGLWGSQYW